MKSKYIPSFLSSRSFMLSIVLMMFFYTILRGIRYPNTWSYTHFLFHYDFGLVKRGIVGAFFQTFGSFYYTYEFFFYFSFVVFFLECLLFLRLFSRLLTEKEWSLWISLLVFVTSQGVIFHAHTVGYFDHIGTLIVLIILNSKPRALTLLIGFLVCLFTHEGTFVFYYPVAFMYFLLRGGEDGVSFRQKLLQLACVSAILLGCCFFLTRQILSPDMVHEMRESVSTSGDKGMINDLSLYILQWDTEKNLKVMEVLWERSGRWRELRRSLEKSQPASIFFALFLVSYGFLHRYSLLYLLLGVLGCFSPLLLHFFAWDLDRFNAMTNITSFLMFYVFISQRGSFQIYGRARYLIALVGIYLVFYNLTTAIYLFDGYIVKDFPFDEHIGYLRGLLLGEPFFSHLP